MTAEVIEDEWMALLVPLLNDDALTVNSRELVVDEKEVYLVSKESFAELNDMG